MTSKCQAPSVAIATSPPSGHTLKHHVLPRRLLADWMGWRAGLSVYPATLRGKVAIVSGANSGIGLETTKALLQVCQLTHHWFYPSKLSTASRRL
jgi:hypothetical protein